MNISKDKKYTVNGRAFTVLTITKPGPLPVAGYDDLGNVHSFTAHGHYGPSSLVEVSPYADFVIDEPVMVRDDSRHTWKHAYFAGVKDGKARAFSFGATQWSSLNESDCWNQCRRPTPEELAS